MWKCQPNIYYLLCGLNLCAYKYVNHFGSYSLSGLEWIVSMSIQYNMFIKRVEMGCGCVNPT